MTGLLEKRNKIPKIADLLFVNQDESMLEGAGHFTRVIDEIG